jgi:hypothetical protein
MSMNGSTHQHLSQACNQLPKHVALAASQRVGSVQHKRVLAINNLQQQQQQQRGKHLVVTTFVKNDVTTGTVVADSTATTQSLPASTIYSNAGNAHTVM